MGSKVVTPKAFASCSTLVGESVLSFVVFPFGEHTRRFSYCWFERVFKAQVLCDRSDDGLRVLFDFVVGETNHVPTKTSLLLFSIDILPPSLVVVSAVNFHDQFLRNTSKVCDVAVDRVFPTKL